MINPEHSQAKPANLHDAPLTPWMLPSEKFLEDAYVSLNFFSKIMDWTTFWDCLPMVKPWSQPCSWNKEWQTTLMKSAKASMYPLILSSVSSFFKCSNVLVKMKGWSKSKNSLTSMKLIAIIYSYLKHSRTAHEIFFVYYVS